MSSPSPEKILKKALRMRADYEALCRGAVRPEVAVGSFEEVPLELLPGVRTKLLLYTPLDRPAGPLPAYVVLHSGAFVRGSAYFDHYVNSVTANRAGCAVAAVEFQLAPEARFPLQIEECRRAIQWIYGHAERWNIDRTRIALGGHNSGGTLAAAVSHQLRDSGLPRLCCVILDCAMFTLLSAHEALPDFEEDDPMKGPLRGTFFNTCYLGDLTLGERDPRASPLYEPSLEGLPPTLVVVAGKDAARPDAEKYYARLQAAGNDCRMICYEELPHGFNVQPGLAPQEIVDRSFEVLDKYLIEYFSRAFPKA